MLIRLLALAFILVLHPAAGPAQEPAGAQESFNDLTRRLEAEDWTPPYFAGKVAIFDFRREEQLLRPALGEPFELVPVGKYSYRTSPRRAEVGKRLFELYDWGTAQIWRSNERYFHYALGVSTAEDLESRYGILSAEGGRLVGIVAIPAEDGRVDYGWSCSLCHEGRGDGGRTVPGAPNHAYNQGLMRHRGLVEHVPHPDFAGPGYVDRDVPIEHLASMGPGRIDQNLDRVENPVKIPALWGLREAKTGIFANGSGGNIWYILGGHNGGTYASSELIESLVAYVLSLEPPPNPAPRGESEQRGEAVFKREGCPACHSGPYYTSGEVIPLDVIGTDPARARQEFPRGYRVPTLRRLDLMRLYLHDGSIHSLPDLFSRRRLGTVPGHEYGLDLSKEETRDLVAFLRSL